MSIGNTLTQGNQGKNTPYQLGNLQALGLVIDELQKVVTELINITPVGGLATETTLQLVDANASTIATNTTGVSRTTGMIRPNNVSGNVNTEPGAATFYSVSVANVGLADGTVLASLTTIKPGEVLNFSADALNNFFTSFAYDATGTEFIIIYVA